MGTAATFHTADTRRNVRLRGSALVPWRVSCRLHSVYPRNGNGETQPRLSSILTFVADLPPPKTSRKSTTWRSAHLKFSEAVFLGTTAAAQPSLPPPQFSSFACLRHSELTFEGQHHRRR